MFKLETIAELRKKTSSEVAGTTLLSAPYLGFFNESNSRLDRTLATLTYRVKRAVAFFQSYFTTKPVMYGQVAPGVSDEPFHIRLTECCLNRIGRTFVLSSTIQLYELGSQQNDPELYLVRDLHTGENAVIPASAVRVLFKLKG